MGWIEPCAEVKYCHLESEEAGKESGAGAWLVEEGDCKEEEEEEEIAQDGRGGEFLGSLSERGEAERQRGPAPIHLLNTSLSARCAASRLEPGSSAQRKA